MSQQLTQQSIPPPQSNADQASAVDPLPSRVAVVSRRGSVTPSSPSSSSYHLRPKPKRQRSINLPSSPSQFAIDRRPRSNSGSLRNGARSPLSILSQQLAGDESYESSFGYFDIPRTSRTRSHSSFGTSPSATSTTTLRTPPEPSSPSSPRSIAECVSPYLDSPYFHASPVFSYRTLHPEPSYQRILHRREQLRRTNTERFTPLPPPLLNVASGQPAEPIVNMANAPLKRKVVILGSPSVGKTSITTQYVTPPTYNEQYYPTIESTSNKTVKYKGVEYDCEIVDTAGQDEFSLFPPKYAIGVHAYMLVYSITSRQSFEMVTTLHEKILDQGGLDKVPCVIVGQKSDLESERRVTTEEGKALAKKLGAAFIESSAKDNKNVDRAFDALLAEMQNEYNPPPVEKKKGWWPFS